MTAAGAQLDERRRLLRLLRREPSPEELARYHRHRLRLLVRHQALRRSTAKPVIRY